jgi:glycosyltransferase involved in cell wall biosynthesis
MVQIGRFTVAKNHIFTVRVLDELVRRGCPVHLLLIGDGPLRPDVQRHVDAAGLADRCTWIVDADNVPAILASVADLKLLPSLHEGLGLAAVEAQAAGVPVLVSDTTPRECALANELIEFLPLTAGPDVWADRILARLSHTPRLLNRHPALRERVLASRFHIARSVCRLTELYTELAENTKKRGRQ